MGNRPPRTAYELTEAGVTDFRRRVEQGLRDGPVVAVEAGWIRNLAARIRSHDIDWPGARPGAPGGTGA